MCFMDMCAFKSILKSTERVEGKGLSMGEEVKRAVFFFFYDHLFLQNIGCLY